MHFEVPKAKTFKEFGGEYLMIVISIVTALALEHTVQTLHHRHLAHEASVKIDAEIQANIQHIDDALAHNVAAVAKLGELRKQLLSGMQNHTADQLLIEQLSLKEKFTLSVRLPTLQHEAWDVAVANQAVSWMSNEQLERYSSAYADMRDVQAINTGGGNKFLDGPRMLDTISNIEMGVADSKEIYRLLGQMLAAYGSVDGNLKSMRDGLAESGKAAPHS